MSETKQWYDHRGKVLDSVGIYEIIECETCHFKHSIPIPTENELDRFYKEEFYTGRRQDTFTRHQEDLDWWDSLYSDQYETYENFLDADRRSIIDIGSGLGFFLFKREPARLGYFRGRTIQESRRT